MKGEDRQPPVFTCQTPLLQRNSLKTHGEMSAFTAGMVTGMQLLLYSALKSTGANVVALDVHGYTSAMALIKQEKQELFHKLFERWRAETGILSDIEKKSMHWAYQEIIGMGEDAVPFMLNDFRNGKYYHWFWALEAITRENPVNTEIAGRVKAMAEVWLEWGRQHGYLAED